MTSRRYQNNEWREFERLIARIEEDASSHGILVKSPDRIRCKITGRLREVDASIRSKVGTTEVLITIECRRRSKIQDVTWIEQLATKKNSIGASRTIAVSSSGFSASAEKTANQYGISLRKLSEVSIADINAYLRLDFVLFWHRSCAFSGIGVRKFRSLDWKMPVTADIDFAFPQNTDLLEPIFCNTETGVSWSINDLWHQLQEATNPFEGVLKAAAPIYRTICFPYPGTVNVTTADGSYLLGDVLLTVALWIEPEQVTLDTARKVEYSSADVPSLQRVEFTSEHNKTNDWRISLQIPKSSVDITDLRTGGNWPKATISKEK